LNFHFKLIPEKWILLYYSLNCDRIARNNSKNKIKITDTVHEGVKPLSNFGENSEMKYFCEKTLGGSKKTLGG
jgi:hypothetical protein